MTDFIQELTNQIRQLLEEKSIWLVLETETATMDLGGDTAAATQELTISDVREYGNQRCNNFS